MLDVVLWSALALLLTLVAFYIGRWWERAEWALWFDEDDPWRAYRHMRNEIARASGKEPVWEE